MVVTSIIPCVKVTKENNMSGIDMYIEPGDHIKITDYEDSIFTGKLLFMELGKDEEEDDILYILLDNGKRIDIGTSYIKDIDIL